MEEPAPVVIEEDAVYLEGVLDTGSGLCILLLHFHCPPEEVQSHQGRLSPLPAIVT